MLHPLIDRYKSLRSQDREIADEVHSALVEGLFSSLLSFSMGALSIPLVTASVAYLSHDPVLVALAVLIAAVALVRIGMVASFLENEKSHTYFRRWERRFQAGAWLYSASTGLFACATIIRSDNPVFHMVVAATAVGYAAVSGRNAGRPLLAMIQLIMSTAPLAIGLLFGPNWIYYGLAAAVVCFMLGMADITLKTHDVIMRSFSASREKAALAEAFKRKARHDDLTGLINRSAFHQHLESELKLLADGTGLLGVFWLDLDRFKDINDTMGHQVGDQLLCAVAKRLTIAVGAKGYVSRFGGDEFVIMARAGSMDEIEAMARALVHEISRPFEVNGHALRTTLSLGTSYAPFHGTDADLLLRSADIALYQAKTNGRARHAMFRSEMQDELERRHKIESSIADSLDRGEFEIVYQPLIDLKTRRIVACEALLRWEHPVLGRVSPAEFIPLAENLGVIVELGDFVLQQACREAAHWPEHVRVSVNLSPRQLQYHNLALAVFSALFHSKLDAHRLELEITETALLDPHEATTDVLRALKLHGVRLALDDFGTGYSSLSHLAQHQFNTLKIDGSFVSGNPDREKSIAIVRAVAGLAASLGIETVAEGIETEQQLAQVSEAGCEIGQGYLLGKPMKVEDLRLLLQPRTGPRSLRA